MHTLPQAVSGHTQSVPARLSISITTCAAINQSEGEQSRLAEEQQKENTLQAILQKVVINYCQLKAATERTTLHLGEWKEAGEERGVQVTLKNRNKHDNVVF